MSQYYVESKSKQPIFFSFNRIIRNQETGLDYELIVREFQDNFDKEQQENWVEYWNKQGEDIILEAWNIKYKDYLKEAQEIGITKNNKVAEGNDNNQEIADKVENLTTDSKKSTSENNLFEENSWEDLWHEHREEIYLEQYLIFSTIYYNYFLDFKKSCEIPQVIEENLEEEEIEDQSVNTDFQCESQKLSEELEQLEILGLPTSFGGRPQCSSKRPRGDKKSSIRYSDFFSDSEMENENSSDECLEDSCKELSNNEKEDDENLLHNLQDKTINKQKKKKRNRKLKNVPAFMQEEKGLLKYWRKRFSLFSRYDEGIRLDRESWFSVTPEKVAKHLAERLKCCTIVDGFCGSGGNAIQFAFTCDRVLAIDIDPVKLEMAKHNAKIYKVAHKIEFILGDFLQLASCGHLKADVVFLSPPWGGPKYKNKKEFDIEKYLLPVKASELMSVSRNVSENVALFLPRNSDIKQIVKLAGIGKRCEIEHNYLDSRLVALTALYGEDLLEKKEAN